MDEDYQKKIQVLIDDLIKKEHENGGLYKEKETPKIDIMSSIKEEQELDIDPEEYGIDRFYASLILGIPRQPTDEFDPQHLVYEEYVRDWHTKLKH